MTLSEQGTDTNQASKDELRAEILTEFKQVHKLAPADYTENCTNVVMSIIRTEKLKLLAEVRERVVEQAKPDKRKATSWQQGIEVAAYEDAVRVYEYKMNGQLTKLEAEL